MIKVGWQTLFRITLPPELPNIYSEWLWTAWLKIYNVDTDAWKSFILKVFECKLINHSKKKWSSDILHWVLLEISEYVSDKADAIRPPVTEESESWPWLTRSSPGVTWSGLTPALATSCRVRSPSSIHRPRWETLTTRIVDIILWLLILYWSNLETCVNKLLCPRRNEMIILSLTMSPIVQ